MYRDKCSAVAEIQTSLRWASAGTKGGAFRRAGEVMGVCLRLRRHVRGAARRARGTAVKPCSTRISMPLMPGIIQTLQALARLRQPPARVVAALCEIHDGNVHAHVQTSTRVWM